jgi:beta-phosphoglucomutase family hydrolase
MDFCVIFDWDGVVVNSLSPHEESWKKLASQLGHTLPEDFLRDGFGMKNEKFIAEVLGWSMNPREIEQLSWQKEEIYRQIVGEQGIEVISGVESFIRDLRENSVPCAIGSSTQRLNISFVLEKLGWEEYFDVIVAADDVQWGKPNPQVFMLCSERLRMPAERCVVFEDTPIGLRAAKTANMGVVGLTTTHGRYQLWEADIIVQNFEELSAQKVYHWFSDRWMKMEKPLPAPDPEDKLESPEALM